MGRQVGGLRWILAITAIGQLVFLGPEPALANTARVAAALLTAALLPLTTRVDDMLDALERGLRPLRRIGMDAERAALLLAVTITTVPSSRGWPPRCARRSAPAGCGRRCERASFPSSCSRCGTPTSSARPSPPAVR